MPGRSTTAHLGGFGAVDVRPLDAREAHGVGHPRRAVRGRRLRGAAHPAAARSGNDQRRSRNEWKHRAALSLGPPPRPCGRSQLEGSPPQLGRQRARCQRGPEIRAAPHPIEAVGPSSLAPATSGWSPEGRHNRKLQEDSSAPAAEQKGVHFRTSPANGSGRRRPSALPPPPCGRHGRQRHTKLQ